MYTAYVIYNHRLNERDFHLALRLPKEFVQPRPGQFVMLRTAESGGPLLSRPLSVYHFTRLHGHVVLELLYRIVGRGTALFSRWPSGKEVCVLGPLGNGFHIDEKKRNHILIAGGMGIAPITYLAAWLCNRSSDGNRMVFCLGAKNSGEFIGLERLEKIGGQFHISTDDGSLGTCGTVTELLPEIVGRCEADAAVLYACGPPGMMKSLASCLPAKVTCQVSVEARMACGVGACLGCAISVLASRKRIVKKSVCRDGPVFDLREICWEDL